MRKRNRKVRKHSSFVTGSVGLVALLFTVFSMLAVYWLLDMRCSAIAQEIGRCEKQLAALEQESVRESARWNAMVTPERLQEKLTRFGLNMNMPRADQVVRMNADGRPHPGQIAVARAQARSSTGDIAQMGVQTRGRMRRSTVSR